MIQGIISWIVYLQISNSSAVKYHYNFRSDKVKKAELLAPVGSFEALKAAVQNGADAVYLGGKKFGARQYASNFDEDLLIEAVEYCHIRGVKVYITVNTLISNKELEEFIEYINFLYNIDVDGVILQDLGVLKYITENLPDFEIHASTQMTIHNLEGIKLLRELGVKRTVIAREMALKDIEPIKQNSDMEIEVFVHGALCICYSGQCLMSSLIGGRSGNRGRCAQPCRLPYKLVELETKKEIKSPYGDYILSPRDLNTLEEIDKLLKLGADSLKIEGRMKRPEYVAVVVKAYRRTLDMYYRDGRVRIGNETKKELTQIFNRRFTKDHLLGRKGNDLMEFEKPGNRGIEIGEVIEYDERKKRLKIKLIDKLQKGDGIEIRTKGKENRGIKVGKIFKGNKVIERALKEEVIGIDFTGRAARGDKIFKTADIALFNRASSTYIGENRIIPISGAIQGRLGGELELYVWDNDGNYINIKGRHKIEKAINKPLTENRIEEQLKKLGNTPYSLRKIEVNIDDDITVPIREINNIRREAIEGLNNLRKNNNNRKKIDFKPIPLINELPREKENNTSLAAYVNNLNQLEAVLTTEINIIYYSNILDIDKAFNLAMKTNKLLIPALNRITYDRELEIIEQKRDILIQSKHILLSNHGQLNMFRHDKINIHGDFSFNVFNSFAVQKLKELGVRNITLSPELNYNQIKDLASKSRRLEVIVYGHLPMMVTEYCPVKTLIKKGDKSDCSLYKSKKYGLKDRYGIIFPLLRDSSYRTQVLNSKKMFLLENMEKIMENNLSIMRLQFTNEDKNEIISIAKAYSKMLNRILDGKKGLPDEILGFIDQYKDKGDYTRGHFSRGVI